MIPLFLLILHFSTSEVNAQKKNLKQYSKSLPKQNKGVKTGQFTPPKNTNKPATKQIITPAKPSFVKPNEAIIDTSALQKDTLKKELKDSTLYNVMHYKLPDSTKMFFKEMMHPETRDSIYYRETDLVDLFIYTFSSKKSSSPPSKLKKPRRVYWSFFPTGNPVARNAIITATNAAFYLGSDTNTKLSNFNFLAFYNLNNQFTFPIRAIIWTARNKYNLQGDYRFYYYPQPIFGLGANSKQGDRNLVTYNYIRFHQNILRKINAEIFLGLGYAWDYHGGISDESPDSEGGKAFRAYKEGTAGSSVSSGVTFNALYDDRSNSINPQKGNYLNAIFRVNGQWIGSDQNWQSVYLDGRKYISLNKRKNQILCFWGLAWFTVSGNPPYLGLPSVGWDVNSTTARGYIQGRYTGKNMLYLESEYRFNLMKNGLIGGVIFSNATAFPTPTTNLNMRILPALGGGLRIKINRDSRTNFAFDYARGIEGSWGIWVSIGEVF